MSMNIGEATRREYQKRINAVIEYIQNNPGRKIMLKELADIAHFSEFHFHRIFRAFTGESISAYIQKIRLSSAAYKLLYRPELSITDIAFEGGFSTLSDFIRAYKARFKTTPKQYRFKKLEKNIVEAKKRKHSFPDKKIAENIRMQKLESVTVVYIMNTGLSEKLENRAIEDSYKKIYNWVRAKGLFSDKTLMIGLYPDNPEILPFSDCRYYACFSVPPDTVPENGMGKMDLELSVDYAVYSFQKNSPFFARRFFKTVLSVYGGWMPDHGYIPDNKPFIEIYRFPKPGKIVMDFCIPVRPMD
jgi:AraC family transcriptional regulator